MKETWSRFRGYRQTSTLGENYGESKKIHLKFYPSLTLRSLFLDSSFSNLNILTFINEDNCVSKRIAISLNTNHFYAMDAQLFYPVRIIIFTGS